MSDADDLLAQDEAQHQHLTSRPILAAAPPPSLPRRLVARVTGKVWYRSGWVCSCNAKWLPLVELVMLTRGLINESIDYFQLNYNKGVDASAGSHDGGGPVDTAQYSTAHIAVWRWAGGTLQRRWPPFDPHAHGGPWGCPHGSRLAKAQDVQWENRQNGLVNHGRVEGPWPVVNYKTGIVRMERELTKFADDIISKTADRAAEKAAKLILAEVATKVWKTDGMVPNDGMTGNTANPNVAASTAFVETFKEVADVRAKVDAQSKQLDALAKAIADLSAKLDQPKEPPIV